MERFKLKSIIILILLLVNVFLLFLVGGEQFRSRRTRQEALDNAAQILAQNGIQLSSEALGCLEGASLSALTAARDVAAEDALARSLLGEDAVCADQSGGLYLYTSPVGSALFRSGGECSVTFESPIETDLPPGQHAAEFLRGLGISAEEVSAVADNGISTVVFRQILEDLPVYSCLITLRYAETALVGLEGSLLTSTAFTSTGETALEGPTALVRFLSGILDSGDVCSAVTVIRPGYRTTPSFSAGMYLQPVWLVITDGSEYYLDGLTGQISRVA